MSQQPRRRVVDDRARTHIKGLIDEAKHQTANSPMPAQMFFSGMLSGLAAAVEILDGGTAEGSMETMVNRLSAAIGQAYLDGQLPPQTPTSGASVDREIAAGVQRCDEAVALYERWVKAGPPPLGTSVSRWWDQRLAELHAAVLPPEQDDEDQEQGAEPPVEAGPARLDQVQPAYDAVSVYIRGLGEYVPTDMVHRNAVIWRGVHAALGATPVGRCVSSHCVEGDHILPVEQSGSPS